jgi:hypothetical protein
MIPSPLFAKYLLTVSSVVVSDGGFAAIWVPCQIAGLPFLRVYRFERRSFGGAPYFLVGVQLPLFLASNTSQPHALYAAAIVGISKRDVPFWARLAGEILEFA